MGGGEFVQVLPLEPLAHEKPCPVLGLSGVDNPDQGIRASRATARIAGSGLFAAIHSRSPQLINEFVRGVPVLGVSVNDGSALGGCGGMGLLSRRFAIMGSGKDHRGESP